MKQKGYTWYEANVWAKRPKRKAQFMNLINVVDMTISYVKGSGVNTRGIIDALPVDSDYVASVRVGRCRHWLDAQQMKVPHRIDSMWPKATKGLIDKLYWCQFYQLKRLRDCDWQGKKKTNVISGGCYEWKLKLITTEKAKLLSMSPHLRNKKAYARIIEIGKLRDWKDCTRMQTEYDYHLKSIEWRKRMDEEDKVEDKRRKKAECESRRRERIRKSNGKTIRIRNDKPKGVSVRRLATEAKLAKVKEAQDERLTVVNEANKRKQYKIDKKRMGKAFADFLLDYT